MNNTDNRQRLLEAIDEYLLYTSVAPGFTPTHLNITNNLLRFIVSELVGQPNTFIQTFTMCITELSKWEEVSEEKGGLGYTLLAMRIQKELRRFKDVHLLTPTG